MPIKRPPSIATARSLCPAISSCHQQNTVCARDIAAKPHPAVGNLVNVNVDGKVLQNKGKPGEGRGHVVWDCSRISSTSRRPSSAQVSLRRGWGSVEIIGENNLPVCDTWI